MANYEADLINGLNALDKARKDIYDPADQYYNGTAGQKFSSAILQQAFGSESPVFNFNYAQKVVHTRHERMEVSSITAQDNSDADTKIGEAWNDNQLDQEIPDALLDMLKYGESYFIVWPRAGDEDGVDIYYNSPLNTRVFYDVENPRKVAYALKRWYQGTRLRVNLYYDDVIVKYITKDKDGAYSQASDFDPYYDEDSKAWPLDNEFDKIPVFHMRNARQYGKPEHINAYGPQDMIDKLIATMADALDFAIMPQRYFLQDPGANDGVNPQEDFGNPDGVVDEDDDDQTSGLRAKAGGVWNLAGIKSVGQFDAPSADGFIKPFNMYVESLCATTSTPNHTLGFTTPPSGESLRAAEAPLNKRVAHLELLAGSALRELFEFVLRLYNIEAKVIVTWEPPASYDGEDKFKKAKLQIEIGIPAEQVYKEMGYTDDQITEWTESVTPQRRSAEQIERIANTIMKLNTAVDNGVITREEARNLLPQDILNSVMSNDVQALPENQSDIEVLISNGVDIDEARLRVNGEG